MAAPSFQLSNFQTRKCVMSDPAETSEQTSSAAKTPTKTPTVKAKTDVAKPATLKCKMLTGQAGVIWKQKIGEDGNPVLGKDGKPVMENRGDYVRNPGSIHDIPADEATRLIEAGACELVE